MKPRQDPGSEPEPTAASVGQAPAHLSGPVIATAGATERVAALVSVILNPLLLSALAVGLVSTGYNAPSSEIRAVVGLSLTFMFVMPLFYLLAMWRTGRIESLSLRDRMNRRWPMIISIVLMVILLPSLLAVAQTSGTAVLSVAGIYLINAILLLMITVRYRISLHAAGLASFISISAVFGVLPSFDGFPGGAALLAVCVACLPLVAWARIRRGVHKPGEVLMGVLFGLIVPTIELSLLVLLGIL